MFYQYGDVKLEMNLEYRFKLFWMIEGALFVDAGNIWSLAYDKEDEDPKKLFDFSRFYNEIAIGSGVGLRMDFDFFVFRFDYGFKVYDPSISGGNKWPGISALSLGEKTLSFGIGYPF